MPDPGGSNYGRITDSDGPCPTAPLERFLLEADGATSLEQLKDSFKIAAAAYDCPWFNCFSLANQDRPPSNAVRILHYPKHRVERYIAQNYVMIDPVLTESLRTHLPLIWDEELSQGQYSAEQIKLFRDAGDAGLRHFLTIPVHKPGALPAVVTLVSDTPFADPARVSLLHLLGLHLHDRADRLINSSDVSHRQNQILTRREQDCITWSAYGKTDHQIADLLSISHNTAHRHLENAKRKLGAFNRAHAVSIAIRLGEIIL